MFNLLGAEGLMATPWWKALIRRRMIRPCGCICTENPLFPGRKMGHVTVVAATVDEALEKVDTIGLSLMSEERSQLTDHTTNLRLPKSASLWAVILTFESCRPPLTCSANLTCRSK